METLSKLFSGEARVKMMRLFLFNPELFFNLEQIVDKTRITAKEVEAEIEAEFNYELAEIQSMIESLAPSFWHGHVVLWLLIGLHPYAMSMDRANSPRPGRKIVGRAVLAPPERVR